MKDQQMCEHPMAFECAPGILIELNSFRSYVVEVDAFTNKLIKHKRLAFLSKAKSSISSIW